MRRLLLIGGVLGLLAGCGGSEPTGPSVLVACESNVDVQCGDHTTSNPPPVIVTVPAPAAQ